MYDQKAQDRASIELRRILEETKGLGRREFLGQLTQAAAGSALLSTLLSLATSREAGAAQPLTTMGFGGEWDKRITESYYKPFTDRSGTPVQIIPYDTAK